jgi:sulfoxide reductase catalytic subunit YedY
MSVATILALAALFSSCYQSEISPAMAPSPQYQEPLPNQGAIAESENGSSQLPVTPVEELHTTGTAPDVDIKQYRLTIEGLVDSPLTLTYELLLKYPTVTDVVLLECPDYFVDNAEWTGVPLSILLTEASIKQRASWISSYGLDGYRSILSLEEVRQADVFLAYLVNGQTLPKEHGFPVRMVVRGQPGNKWVKWLERIEVE